MPQIIFLSLSMKCIRIKENLVFDNHSGSLTGFTDLGDVCKLLAEYKQLQNGDGSRNFCRPVAKCMVVFMVRGLFTNLKFAYMLNSLLLTPKDVTYLFYFGKQFNV